MNEEDISGGYWNDNNEYPIEDWKYEVANNDTRRGYHEWIEACIERDKTYESL